MRSLIYILIQSLLTLLSEKNFISTFSLSNKSRDSTILQFERINVNEFLICNHCLWESLEYTRTSSFSTMIWKMPILTNRDYNKCNLLDYSCPLCNVRCSSTVLLVKPKNIYQGSNRACEQIRVCTLWIVPQYERIPNESLFATLSSYFLNAGYDVLCSLMVRWRDYPSSRLTTN